MKKIIFTLAALAALSTVSFAGENRGYDLRDSDTYFGKYSTHLKDNAASAVSSAALAVSGDTGTMTNFERVTTLSIENDRGRHQIIPHQTVTTWASAAATAVSNFGGKK